MNNTVSINRIVALFNDLAIRHKMVQTFGFGRTYDATVQIPSNERKYPMVWLDVPNTEMVKSLNGYSEEVFTFELYVLDRINKGQNNYQEILSDTHYILNTMVTEMAQHKMYIDLNVSLINNITMEAVTEAQDDDVNGYKAVISLKVPNRFTPCNTPIDPITGYTYSLRTPGSSIYQITYYGPTGPAGANGATGPTGPQGATGPGANITASNGLSKVSDDIRLGGTLSTNTTIVGPYQLYIGTNTVFLDSQGGNIDIAANGGDLNMSGENSVTIGSIGNSALNGSTITSFADNSITVTADLGDYTINSNGGNVLLNAISGSMFLDTSLGTFRGRDVLTLRSTSNLFQIVESPTTVTNNGSNNNMIATDNTSSKGIVYAADYSANFTPESLITKRYMTNYVATASSNVSAINGVTYSGGFVKLGGPLTENTSITTNSFTFSINGTFSMESNKILNVATGSNNLDAVNVGQMTNTKKISFGFGADGAGGTLAVGTPTYLIMSHQGTITQWDIIGNTSGSASFDIWKSTNGQLPTVANTITAAAKPTIISATVATSTGLTGWGLTYSAGDIYGFNIDSISSFTKVNLSLRANKS